MNKIQLPSTVSNHIWDQWIDNPNKYAADTFEEEVEDLMDYYRSKGWNMHWEYCTNPRTDIAFYLPANQLDFFILSL